MESATPVPNQGCLTKVSVCQCCTARALDSTHSNVHLVLTNTFGHLIMSVLWKEVEKKKVIGLGFQLTSDLIISAVGMSADLDVSEFERPALGPCAGCDYVTAAVWLVAGQDVRSC